MRRRDRRGRRLAGTAQPTRLHRLGTLTYAGADCYDPRELRARVQFLPDVARADLGGKPMAYLWTAEWHKSDHGLHVHFAVGRYISRQVIERAWGRGFVHIKHLSDLPVRLDVAGQSRQAARYLSKYVGKAIDERRVPGLHRYEVARGFQPQSIRLYGRTVDEVLDVASQHMGDGPAYEWSSSEALDWQGPPAVWVMGRLTDDAMAAWVAALRRHVRVLACRSDQQSTSKADAAHSA